MLSIPIPRQGTETLPIGAICLIAVLGLSIPIPRQGTETRRGSKLRLTEALFLSIPIPRQGTETGQEKDTNLRSIFLEELSIPIPRQGTETNGDRYLNKLSDGIPIVRKKSAKLSFHTYSPSGDEKNYRVNLI